MPTFRCSYLYPLSTRLKKLYVISINSHICVYISKSVFQCYNLHGPSVWETESLASNNWFIVPKGRKNLIFKQPQRWVEGRGEKRVAGGGWGGSRRYTPGTPTLGVDLVQVTETKRQEVGSKGNPAALEDCAPSQVQATVLGYVGYTLHNARAVVHVNGVLCSWVGQHHCEKRQRAEVSKAEHPTFSQENLSDRISPWLTQPSPGGFSSEQKPSLQWTLFHHYQSALLHSTPPSKDLGTPKPSGAPGQPQGWTYETLQLYLGVLGTPELSHVNHTHTHCVYSGDNSKTDKTCNCSFRVTRKV